jgi:hypothetical protein
MDAQLTRRKPTNLKTRRMTPRSSFCGFSFCTLGPRRMYLP